MNRRARIVIRGAVQGVGFRPFVYRLASALELSGWVRNSAAGVLIEIEGGPGAVEEFLLRLPADRPPRAIIQSLEFSFLDPAGYSGFEIRPSAGEGGLTAFVLPDVATCADCLREILDPADRRYLYPFTNCTNCGPRYSIIESLPYDRPNTSMKRFAMCKACEMEYHDPASRRFHAQPNACQACGPRLGLWDPSGAIVCHGIQALVRAAAAIGRGEIVAVKGLGGFHLLADACSTASVERLRARKRRGEKPFALMYPSIEAVEGDCRVGRLERRLLLSPESPIVLLSRRAAAGGVAPSVAPGNPYLGVMLPYTPLHHLLMREIGAPVVATSGNLSEEPICTDEKEALDRLAGITDLFLVHDRPIVRHVDDSIVRVVLGRELVLRRARGYAPLPVAVRSALPPILAVGGHLKNSVALAVAENVFISQHIGDLENNESLEAFRKVIAGLQTMYRAEPVAIAADLHPDYLSTRYAAATGIETIPVQHHYAHVCACMAENDLEGTVLGVAWDGTGYGTDGKVWGGEFLVTGADGFSRAATLREFTLPGGERAVREPRRAALGLLFASLGQSVFGRRDLAPVRAFKDAELAILRRMLERGLNSPATTSVGRLFDAVASLADLRQVSDYEGQAAMALEFAAAEDVDEAYPFLLKNPEGTEAPLVVDWSPTLDALIADLQRSESVGVLSARFHNTLAEAIVQVAARVGQRRIVLTGGCFQNRYLLERTVRRLTEAGFLPYWHQRVPPNDGGLCLGQALAAARQKAKR